MKATELMTGDWVYNTHNKQPEQVVEIREHMVMLAYNDLYDYDDIEPIPLTAEILEKNGWKEEHDGIARQYVSEDCRVILHDDDRFLNTQQEWYIHIDSVDMRTIGCLELTFVHELQHFLWLCNIEKEIVINDEG